jgi:hypothetical protein
MIMDIKIALGILLFLLRAMVVVTGIGVLINYWNERRKQ